MWGSTWAATLSQTSLALSGHFNLLRCHHHDHAIKASHVFEALLTLCGQTLISPFYKQEARPPLKRLSTWLGDGVRRWWGQMDWHSSSFRHQHCAWPLSQHLSHCLIY